MPLRDSPSSPIPHLGAPTEAGGHMLLSTGLPCLFLHPMLTRSLLPAGAGGADFISGIWSAGPMQGTALLTLGVVVPKCPHAEEHPKMVPVWVVAGGGSEGGSPWSNACSAPASPSQRVSSVGFPLKGCCTNQESCGSRGIPGKLMESHILQESPNAVTHGCPLVIWLDDAVGKAPFLESAQLWCCQGGAAQERRFWKGSREQTGGVGGG